MVCTPTLIESTQGVNDHCDDPDVTKRYIGVVVGDVDDVPVSEIVCR